MSVQLGIRWEETGRRSLGLLVLLAMLALLFPALAQEPTPAPPSALQSDREAPVPFSEETGGFEQNFRDDPGMGKMAAQALASLVVVVVVAVGSLLIARRFMPAGGRRSGATLAVVETTVVGPKKSLHVVRVGARTFLVGCGVSEVRLLADVTADIEIADAAVEIADGEAPADADGAHASFSGVLKQLIGSRSK